MKKVLILQNEGKIYGGVWQVNKLIGEELLKKEYNVHIVSIRNRQTDFKLEHHQDLIVKTINEKDSWETYHFIDLIQALKSFHFIKSIKIIISKFVYNLSLKKDIKKLHQYINNYNPNYIVTSHYQLLDMIPKYYLKKTIHEQHSSFEDAFNHKATRKTFNKYKDKIKFLWLTKTTMDNAISKGYENSTYIYNAVRIKSQKRSNVINNKKLITIARLSKEKNIDKMIEMVSDIFKEKKYQDWTFEIHGTGLEEPRLRKMITDNSQIKLMGLTNDPKSVLLTSSINLNTSKYEGFSLSILEANECGIPTIAFNFGESTNEQILNGKTGIIAKNINDYKDKLKELMDNPNKLEKLSINAKEYSQEFQIEKIINKWIELFEDIKQEQE